MKTQPFPGTLFSREAKKRDPGNEVDESQGHVFALRDITQITQKKNTQALAN